MKRNILYVKRRNGIFFLLKVNLLTLFEIIAVIGGQLRLWQLPPPTPPGEETGTFQVTGSLLWPFKPPLKMHCYSWLLSMCNLWYICISAPLQAAENFMKPYLLFYIWMSFNVWKMCLNREFHISTLTQDRVVWFGLVCWLLLLVWAGCWPSVLHTHTHIELGISERYTSVNEKSVGGTARAAE